MSSPFPSKLSKRVSKEMGSSMRSIDSILENLEDGKSRSSSDGATSPDHIYDMKHQWRAVLEQIKECTPDMNQEEVQLSVENCTNVLHRAGYVSFFLFSNVFRSNVRPSQLPTLIQTEYSKASSNRRNSKRERK